MARTIYLAVFSNSARPAHFSVFIPIEDTGDVGKLIHVTGTTATRVFLQFKRHYDIGSTKRKYQLIPLAQVDDHYIADTAGNMQGTDTTARDRLESVATTVPAPGPSPKPFDPSAVNCQDWLLSFVEKLVQEGYIDSSAISVVQNAPKTI